MKIVVPVDGNDVWEDEHLAAKHQFLRPARQFCPSVLTWVNCQTAALRVWFRSYLMQTVTCWRNKREWHSLGFATLFR